MAADRYGKLQTWELPYCLESLGSTRRADDGETFVDVTGGILYSAGGGCYIKLARANDKEQECGFNKDYLEYALCRCLPSCWSAAACCHAILLHA